MHEQIKLIKYGEYLLPFGPELPVFPFAKQNIKIKVHRLSILPVVL
jgi:hypothetical protein